MPTRIAFSTHYPDRMGDLAGKPTRFPEKLIAGLDIDQWIKDGYRWRMRDAGYNIQISNVTNVKHPKTTTIRKNYDYWKSKEGKMIQPYFWSGRPRRSKQVVFCPPVLLARVRRALILPGLPYVPDSILVDYDVIVDEAEIRSFTKNEGFDHPDHFWMWFDKDCDGAYLELESVGE